MHIRCLVLDHDDTVVRSCQTVNFPSMLEVLKRLRPGHHLTLEEFQWGCFAQNFEAFCQTEFGFTEAEKQLQWEMWKAYVREHIPPAYDGMPELLRHYRAAGGLICVSSHSSAENINRDYEEHMDFRPDRIFGWELGEQRKPHPYAMERIMEDYGLQPEQLLMVDDAKVGCDMAHACQVPFACAGWAYSDSRIMSAMRQCCDYYLSTVAELETLIFDK